MLALLERFQCQKVMQIKGEEAHYQGEYQGNEQSTFHFATPSSFNAPPQLLPCPAVQPKQ